MSIEGSLLQLVAVRAQNSQLKNMYSKLYSKMLINMNTYDNVHIIKDCDLYLPLFLSFNMKDKEMNLSEFENLFVNTEISIFNKCNCELIKLDFKFLMKLHPIQKICNKYVIKLPFSIMLGHINFLSCEINVRFINFPKNLEAEVELVSEKVFLELEEREKYSQNYNGQLMMMIENVNNLKVNCVKNYYQYYETKYCEYSYNVEIEKQNACIGLFLEFDSPVNELKLNYKNKEYALKDLEKISDRLYYFAPNGLKLSDKNNFIVKPSILPDSEIIIKTNKPVDFKYFKKTAFILHMFGCKRIDKIHIQEMCESDYYSNHQMYIKFSRSSEIIEKIYNLNVKDFANENVNQEFIYKNIKPEFTSVRFVDCVFDEEIIFPPYIKTLILENCQQDLTNLQEELTSIWLLNSVNQTNLPIGIKKIYSSNISNIKTPFGCKVIKIALI